ncbi:MAG: hypothetical protein IJ881_05820 [Neisseriaceae bacterium]|nr:hypothetical protein [Neisseriaceae bacterium]
MYRLWYRLSFGKTDCVQVDTAIRKRISSFILCKNAMADDKNHETIETCRPCEKVRSTLCNIGVCKA